MLNILIQVLGMNVVYMIPILSVIKTEENGKLCEMQVLHRNVEIDLIMILIIKSRLFRLSVIMKILKRYRALFVN